MKRLILFFILLSAALSQFTVQAAFEYIGYMEVVNCDEWVSLREVPSTTAKRLTQVPLGATVINCQKFTDEWTYAEYDGYGGYILAKYLKPMEGSIAFSAMLVTNLGSTVPFYTHDGLKSRTPSEMIEPNTIVRDGYLMSDGMVNVKYKDRYGYISLEHLMSYTDLFHYPQSIILHESWYDPAVPQETPALRIAALEDFSLTEGEYTLYTQDTHDPKTSFVLYTDSCVNNVHLFLLEMLSMDDQAGIVTYSAFLENIQYQLDSKTPLLIEASIYGTIPNLAVGYQDPLGAYHFAFVEISGEDGELLLREF